MTTVLGREAVLSSVGNALSWRAAEQARLDLIFNYVRDRDNSGHINLAGESVSTLRWLSRDAPDAVKRLAVLSRVNMLKLVVSGAVQVMYVDGYRAPEEEDESPAWDMWQRNRMDARQIAVHRSALTYGCSYVTVLPGDPVPVIRGASPRFMTAVYGDDDEWPEFAIERRRHPQRGMKLWRLYDAANAWWIEEKENGDKNIVDQQVHNVGFCPVVRFLSEMNDDGVVEGDVEGLIPLQDQINVTTFGLQVAQHYGAFRQRYIMGWVANSEEQALTASARKLWTFEDSEVKVGEFQQTDLRGYIDSREASLKHLATISQTPAHELLGQLVNLGAEALAAAESSRTRKVKERQTSFGESWEQVLELAVKIAGGEADPAAQVRWQDAEARSLSQSADALTKLVAGLGVPAQEVWEKIPGVTQTDVERWKAVAAEQDAIAQLNATLAAQSATPETEATPPGAEYAGA